MAVSKAVQSTHIAPTCFASTSRLSAQSPIMTTPLLRTLPSFLGDIFSGEPRQDVSGENPFCCFKSKLGLEEMVSRVSQSVNVSGYSVSMALASISMIMEKNAQSCPTEDSLGLLVGVALFSAEGVTPCSVEAPSWADALKLSLERLSSIFSQFHPLLGEIHIGSELCSLYLKELEILHSSSSINPQSSDESEVVSPHMDPLSPLEEKAEDSFYDPEQHFGFASRHYSVDSLDIQPLTSEDPVPTSRNSEIKIEIEELEDDVENEEDDEDVSEPPCKSRRTEESEAPLPGCDRFVHIFTADGQPNGCSSEVDMIEEAAKHWWQQSMLALMPAHVRLERYPQPPRPVAFELMGAFDLPLPAELAHHIEKGKAKRPRPFPCDVSSSDAPSIQLKQLPPEPIPLAYTVYELKSSRACTEIPFPPADDEFNLEDDESCMVYEDFC